MLLIDAFKRRFIVGDCTYLYEKPVIFNDRTKVTIITPNEEIVIYESEKGERK